MYLIKFYGITCRAIITDDSFELIGRTRLSRKLLNTYAWLIMHAISAGSFICSVLAIDYTTSFRLDIIRKLKDGE
jgi:hypothetical protein